MVHLSENSARLKVKDIRPQDFHAVFEKVDSFNDVCILRLPYCVSCNGNQLIYLEHLVSGVVERLGSNATLIVVGENFDLAYVHKAINGVTQYQHWMAIKRHTIRKSSSLSSLPHHHFGALIHTKYGGSLRHTKTRIKYSYCPACKKTTKDYGGKKHTYHEYGTLLSDVWRDISCDLEGDLTPLVDRFADLFGLELYEELRLIDCRNFLKRSTRSLPTSEISEQRSLYSLPENPADKLILGDCLEHLKEIPDNTIDFAFTDPPYNLNKKYSSYTDDLKIVEYFEWCDRWITEMARVLRPGKTLALLNIPIWAARHFLHLETALKFQNWLVWDALSYPVRKIMPAHYTILCFSKGEPRSLPGLRSEGDVEQEDLSFPSLSGALKPLAEGFCLRQQCLKSRKAGGVDDRGPLTDLWWDIHRLKHNSRRVDHPTQLPPQLMYRLISVFTEPEETVLDCFNGAGTTTLAAHQMNRRYTGLEISEKYHEIAQARHEEIRNGIDPFRKADRLLTAKNSPVPRRAKQKYEVSKRELQLEVRKVAIEIGRLPTRSELAELGKYPIKHYDDYFASWGEVCAAARTTGMTENPVLENGAGVEQPSLLDAAFHTAASKQR